MTSTIKTLLISGFWAMCASHVMAQWNGIQRFGHPGFVYSTNAFFPADTPGNLSVGIANLAPFTPNAQTRYVRQRIEPAYGLGSLLSDMSIENVVPAPAPPTNDYSCNPDYFGESGFGQGPYNSQAQAFSSLSHLFMSSHHSCSFPFSGGPQPFKSMRKYNANSGAYEVLWGEIIYETADFLFVKKTSFNGSSDCPYPTLCLYKVDKTNWNAKIWTANIPSVASQYEQEQIKAITQDNSGNLILYTESKITATDPKRVVRRISSVNGAILKTVVLPISSMHSYGFTAAAVNPINGKVWLAGNIYYPGSHIKGYIARLNATTLQLEVAKLFTTTNTNPITVSKLAFKPSSDTMIIYGVVSGILPKSNHAQSKGLGDVYISQLSASGNRVWTTQFGSIGQARFDIAADDMKLTSDGIYVVGRATSYIGSGSPVMGSLIPTGFVAKLNYNGIIQ